MLIKEGKGGGEELGEETNDASMEKESLFDRC